MAYMIALNVIGVLVVRSATNKDRSTDLGQICQQRKTLDRSSGTWTASAFRICKNWSDYYFFLVFYEISGKNK